MTELCRCTHARESHGILPNEGGREGCLACGCRLFVPAATGKAETYPEGTVFAPSYRAGSRHGPNRCLIDDADFTSSDPDLAAKIAHDARDEAEIGYGLFWDGKVVPIKPGEGIRNVPGIYGKTKVLWIQGPGFDKVQEQERKLREKLREGAALPKRLTENEVPDA